MGFKLGILTCLPFSQTETTNPPELDACKHTEPSQLQQVSNLRAEQFIRIMPPKVGVSTPGFG